MMSPSRCSAIILLTLVGFACGCHSYHIDATVENHTGSAIDLLEVDYPSASFGADSLAAAAEYHHRFQVRGSGQIKVQYSDSSSHQARQITGPELFEGQEGRLEIILLPGGRVDFHPDLTPPR